MSLFFENIFFSIPLMMTKLILLCKLCFDLLIKNKKKNAFVSNMEFSSYLDFVHVSQHYILEKTIDKKIVQIINFVKY